MTPTKENSAALDTGLESSIEVTLKKGYSESAEEPDESFPDGAKYLPVIDIDEFHKVPTTEEWPQKTSE